LAKNIVIGRTTLYQSDFTSVWFNKAVGRSLDSQLRAVPRTVILFSKALPRSAAGGKAQEQETKENGPGSGTIEETAPLTPRVSAASLGRSDGSKARNLGWFHALLLPVLDFGPCVGG
jgi:hypothetical protein